MNSYFPKKWSHSFLNLNALPNIYLRIKFDLVLCFFNSAYRRHVNIVDINPGGYSEFFPIHRLGLFLGGQSFEFRYLFWILRKKWIFLG